MKIKNLFLLGCAITLLAGCNDNSGTSSPSTSSSSITSTSQGKVLEGLTVKNAIKKYTAGEMFNREGMIVTAYYSDESTEVVTDYTVEPNRALTVNDKYVYITYKTLTVPLGITVTEPSSLS